MTPSNPTKQLYSEISPVASLSGETREQMFQLLARYYAHVDRASFERDLEQKDEVILLRDSSAGRIQGFSTLLFLETVVFGKKLRGVFSGDTIVDENYWGQTALHRAFVRRLLKEKVKRPFQPFFWFLISKGYKTYLLMANNFTDYYPSMDAYRGGLSRESKLRAVAHSFARTLFRDSFVPQEGIIRLKGVAPCLKADVAPIAPSELLRNPKIAFFQKKNPGWSQGEELVCVGELNRSMVLRFGFKLLRKNFRRAGGPQVLR